MEQFNLKKYLENTERKVVTRDGRPVRIICTNRKGLNTKPIVALITIPNNDEVIKSYWEDGIETRGTEYENDLFFAPEKKEGWINIFKGIFNDNRLLGHTRIFKTKENAEEAGEGVSGYITTIKIEWEE